MIYLIKSSAYKDKSCKDHEDILKIGYTSEESKKSRFDCYITENPTCQVLYLIPGGTEQDEKCLHRHFNKYLKYGQEWFSYEQEILDFFKTHTTKESLKELNYLREDLRKLIEKKYFNSILLSLVSEPKIYFNIRTTLYNELDNILKTVEDFDSYFKLRYPNINFEEEYILEKDNKEFDFIESFKSEFNSDNNFERRMKMYCRLVTEFPDVYKQNIKIFQTIIPTNYQGYMNLIGPERIRANSYIESDIRNECEAIIGKNNLKPEILIKFRLGQKYSNKHIKAELSEIYSRLRIKKAAKASDLSDWFDLKDCKVLNPDTNKWDRGFEILGVK